MSAAPEELPIVDAAAIPHQTIRLDAPAAPAATADALELADKHILIVGINYAPEPTGIAPYTTEMAEHLAKVAGSVSVIAGLPCYPTWKVEDGYGNKLRTREVRNGVHVTRLAHHVPSKGDALRRGLYEATFFAQAATAKVERVPDIVIGVTPALGGAAAAARIARRHGAQLFIVVQDLMGRAAAQSGMTGGGRVASIASRLEAKALRQADRIMVVTDAFRPQLDEYGIPQERISTLPNWAHVCSPSGDRDAVRGRFGWAPNVTIALHTGNMGFKQDLGNIVEAARLTQHRSDLHWVLMGDGNQREKLEALGAGLANLTFLPPCDKADYAEILGAADVLLLNERASVDDMSLPSKMTSYFMSGRPVAAAVPLQGATATELARAGAALPVPAGEPDALVDLVNRLALHPEPAAEHGERQLRYAVKNLTSAGAMAKLTAILVGTQRASIVV